MGTLINQNISWPTATNTSAFPAHTHSIGQSIGLSTGIHTATGIHTHANSGVAKPTRRLSPFEKKYRELTKRSPLSLPEKVSEYFVSRGGDAIAVFGNTNPLYNGRPNQLAATMLQLASAPDRRAPGIMRLKNMGLVFSMPFIAGKRKITFRLSSEGVALLDHWANRYKRFRPFVDAYLTKKARKEIACLCIDLQLGVLPAEFDTMLAEHGRRMIAIERKRIEEVRKQVEAQQQLEAERNEAYFKLQQQANMRITSGAQPIWTGINHQDDLAFWNASNLSNMYSNNTGQLNTTDQKRYEELLKLASSMGLK